MTITKINEIFKIRHASLYFVFSEYKTAFSGAKQCDKKQLRFKL